MKLIPTKTQDMFIRYVCVKCKRTFMTKRRFCPYCKGPFVVKMKLLSE